MAMAAGVARSSRKLPGETKVNAEQNADGVVLPWGAPLVRGALLRRYHRFLADVRLEEGPRAGEVVVAHCVNSGRMEGLVRKGCAVWLTPAANPKRKLQFTWEMSELDGVRVGANTARPNPLVHSMLERRALAGFEKHQGFVAEKTYGENSRVDFAVRTAKGEHLIEVKNCHLVYPDGGAYWPDSVSERGAKHLRELAAVARSGGLATVLFVVQRSDARFVRPSDLHDPEFAKAAREGAAAGVRFRAVRTQPEMRGLRVLDEIPVDLDRYELDRVEKWADERKKDTGWERPKAAKKSPADPKREPDGEPAKGATKQQRAVASRAVSKVKRGGRGA